MDTKTLINNLKQVFCDSQKQGRKYSEVWLSDVDFGGLYHTDKYYILNVKAEHTIDSCSDEIKDVLDLLNEKAKGELTHIWRVDVYHSNDDFYCMGDDLLVYTEDKSC